MAEVEDRIQRKQRTGQVASNKMDKSITVAVDRQIKHPIYGKFITKTTKYMAHDEENSCRIGDKVEILESGPLSRRKRWVVDKILERAA